MTVEAYRGGDVDGAVAIIDRSGLAGASAEINYLQGACMVASRRLAEGVACFDRALALKPDFADAWCSRGLTLNDLRHYADAILSFDRALGLRPANALAWFHRGLALAALDRAEEALASYENAVRERPAYRDALGHRGLMLKKLGRPEEALAAFDAAIAADPASPAAWSARGTILETLRRPEDALAAYEAALARNGDYFEAWYNRGNVLRALDRPEAALASYDQALRHRPGFAPALANRGAILQDLGRIEEALASLDLALTHDPTDEAARLNRGVALLLTGDFTRGWADYEARWHHAGAHPPFITGPWPAFNGQPLDGKTLVVRTEQGMGDILQFVRYLALARGANRRIVFAVPRLMHRILRAAVAGIEVRDEFAATDHADFQCALMSLPHVLGTTLATIPAPKTYLEAEKERVAIWKARIGPAGFRVGVVWQGKPTSAVDRGRSIPLSAFAALAAIPGIRLISLQKEHGLDQLARLPAGMRVETLGPDFDAGPDAFVDTAAAMMAVDLIVTSDTAVPHLAGALGRPVFVALKRVPDWRWMMSGSTSPWYPSMRLFRQKQDGAWDDVFAEIAAEVAWLAASGVAP